MNIADNVIEFPDNCDYGRVRAVEDISKKSVSSNVEKFLLYPNPNNGLMILDYTLDSKQSGNFDIYDVTGKLMKRFEIIANSTRMEISDSQLTNGIYFYRITINGQL